MNEPLLVPLLFKLFPMQSCGLHYSNKENLYPRRATLSGHKTPPSQATPISAESDACHPGDMAAGNYEKHHQLQLPAPSLNASTSVPPTQSDNSMLGITDTFLGEQLIRAHRFLCICDGHEGTCWLGGISRHIALCL